MSSRLLNSSPRVFTLRHVWIILGALSLMALAGIAFVWVVLYREQWLHPILGRERTALVWVRCFSACLALPAMDSDGDGFPDWVETDFNKDPLLSSSHPPLHPLLARDGGIYTAERTRLKWRWLIRRQLPGLRWPAGFRVMVRSKVPILLATGSNGPPQLGPIALTASPDGSLEFDVLISDPNVPARIIFSHSDPKVSIDSPFGGYALEVYGWRQPAWPAIPATIESVGRDGYRPHAGAPDTRDESNPREIYLVWRPRPEPGLQYVIEAARADRPDEWFTAGDAANLYAGFTWPRTYLPYSFPSYRGPLLYRIMPTTRARPQPVRPRRPPLESEGREPPKQPPPQTEAPTMDSAAVK